MCTLYTYTNICMPTFSPSAFFGPYRCLIPTPGLIGTVVKNEYPICAVCVFYGVFVCIYTHIHPHTNPPALRIKQTQTTPTSFFVLKIIPHAKQQLVEPPLPRSVTLNEQTAHT